MKTERIRIGDVKYSVSCNSNTENPTQVIVDSFTEAMSAAKQASEVGLIQMIELTSIDKTPSETKWTVVDRWVYDGKLKRNILRNGK
tara:strand:+ start:81 stop:341 length:261 start_codon:yes stop_codon:yes gene_type:complete